MRTVYTQQTLVILSLLIALLFLFSWAGMVLPGIIVAFLFLGVLILGGILQGRQKDLVGVFQCKALQEDNHEA